MSNQTFQTSTANQALLLSEHARHSLKTGLTSLPKTLCPDSTLAQRRPGQIARQYYRYSTGSPSFESSNCRYISYIYTYVIYQQQVQQHLLYSSWIQDGGTCLTRLRFQRNYGSDTKIYTFFNIFFTTFDILTPKLCVQRITKKENVKKLPKLN